MLIQKADSQLFGRVINPHGSLQPLPGSCAQKVMLMKEEKKRRKTRAKALYQPYVLSRLKCGGDNQLGNFLCVENATPSHPHQKLQ